MFYDRRQQVQSGCSGGIQWQAKCMIAACRDAELVPEIFGTFAPSAAR